jgi:hypothetical protein
MQPDTALESRFFADRTAWTVVELKLTLHAVAFGPPFQKRVPVLDPVSVASMK